MIDDVIKRLRAYNKWRTGKDERTMQDAGIEPSIITKDIDYICQYVFELQRKIREANIFMDIDFREIQDLKNQIKKLKSK